MNALIQRRLPELTALCRVYGVRRLDLFGSAARDEDRPDSDFDFLVRLEAGSPVRYADAYFGLKAGLERLFERDIDLVTEASLRNPYRRARIEAEKKLVFEA